MLSGGFGDFTVTVSSTGASSSCTSSTAVWPAASWTSLEYGVNLLRVTSTVYVPGLRPERAYSPVEPVRADFAPAGPFASTCAPTTAPPRGSVTRPRSVAGVSSAAAREAESRTGRTHLTECSSRDP